MYLTLFIDSSCARKDLYRMYWCSACFADDCTNFGLFVFEDFLKWNVPLQLFMIIFEKEIGEKKQKSQKADIV